MVEEKVPKNIEKKFRTAQQLHNNNNNKKKDTIIGKKFQIFPNVSVLKLMLLKTN